MIYPCQIIYEYFLRLPSRWHLFRTVPAPVYRSVSMQLIIDAIITCWKRKKTKVWCFLVFVKCDRNLSMIVYFIQERDRKLSEKLLLDKNWEAISHEDYFPSYHLCGWPFYLELHDCFCVTLCVFKRVHKSDKYYDISWQKVQTSEFSCYDSCRELQWVYPLLLFLFRKRMREEFGCTLVKSVLFDQLVTRKQVGNRWRGSPPEGGWLDYGSLSPCNGGPEYAWFQDIFISNDEAFDPRRSSPSVSHTIDNATGACSHSRPCV